MQHEFTQNFYSQCKHLFAVTLIIHKEHHQFKPWYCYLWFRVL